MVDISDEFGLGGEGWVHSASWFGVLKQPAVDSSEKRCVVLGITGFGREALAAVPAEDDSARLRTAILQYLATARAGRLAFPRFRRLVAADRAGSGYELELGSAAWSALEREAGRDAVSVEDLIEHAVFTHVAKRDELLAGR